MKQIAKFARDDSQKMKIASLIMLVYLPATLVAVGYAMTSLPSLSLSSLTFTLGDLQFQSRQF